MNKEPPANMDEGLIVFKKIDDGTFGIQGVGLTEGEVVTVSTKSGADREVVVKDIVDDSHGIQTALYDWARDVDFVPGLAIFKKLDDGTFGIQGLDLTPGESVTVTKKDGSTREVVVDDIIDLDENLATATYVHDGTEFGDDGTISFRRLDDGTWGIRGADLEEGRTVTVTKKSGDKTQARVVQILSDNNGIQTASVQPLAEK